MHPISGAYFKPVVTLLQSFTREQALGACFAYIVSQVDGAITCAVTAWIGSAYFFTSSTLFVNPAVTVGRLFTDTFAGIAPGSIIPYIGAQLVGAVIGVLIVTAFKSA